MNIIDFEIGDCISCYGNFSIIIDILSNDFILQRSDGSFILVHKSEQIDAVDEATFKETEDGRQKTHTLIDFDSRIVILQKPL